MEMLSFEACKMEMKSLQEQTYSVALATPIRNKQQQQNRILFPRASSSDSKKS